MLKVIRKGVDSVVIKILLGIIALSFVGIGGVSLMKGNSKGDVVTFSQANPITMEDFWEAKKQKIDIIQKQNSINLTEKQIAELDLDNAILKDLISKAMMDYLARIYDFDISDAQVANFVKRIPAFHNKDGRFDAEIFKNAFKGSMRDEEAYLGFIEDQLINNSLLNVFVYSYPFF